MLAGKERSEVHSASMDLTQTPAITEETAEDGDWGSWDNTETLWMERERDRVSL